MSHADVEALIEQELPNLPGWCGVEKGKRMAEIARGASLCVELGVFGGRGLIAMALSLKDQGFGRADGIDPFTAEASLEGTNDPANDEWWAKLDYKAIEATAMKALARLGLEPYSQIVRLLSRDAATAYIDQTIDVLHQDSNHAEEISSQEVIVWAPKIRPGGYWIFDDTNWPTTEKAQKMLELLGFEQLEDHESWKVYRAPCAL